MVKYEKKPINCSKLTLPTAYANHRLKWSFGPNRRLSKTDLREYARN